MVRWVVFGVVVVCLLGSQNLRAGFPDDEAVFWGDYERLLQAIVSRVRIEGDHGEFVHTVVDYGVVEEDRNDPKSKQLVLQLLSSQSKKLKDEALVRSARDADASQSLAFWMNAYNFFTLKSVLEAFPVESMQSVGWKKKIHEVAGKKYSLDGIEHTILRPMGEPAIHFGINCAAVSCPPLVDAPFNSKTVKDVLATWTRNAMKSPLFARVDAKKNLHYTEIFDWFAVDFKTKPYKNFLDFVRAHQSENFPAFRKAKKSIPYDWALNTRSHLVEHVERLRQKNPSLNLDFVGPDDASD